MEIKIYFCVAVFIASSFVFHKSDAQFTIDVMANETNCQPLSLFYSKCKLCVCIKPNGHICRRVCHEKVKKKKRPKGKGNCPPVIDETDVKCLYLTEPTLCLQTTNCSYCAEKKDGCSKCHSCGSKQRLRTENCEHVIEQSVCKRQSWHVKLDECCDDIYDINLYRHQMSSITIKFVMSNLPLDVYFLIDTSASMKDRLQQFQKFSRNVINKLKHRQKNVRIGFGIFNDKPIDENERDREYSYKNILAPTENTKDFIEKISNIEIGSSSHSKRSMLIGLHQATMCQSTIKWNPYGRRLIVILTDADYHEHYENEWMNLNEYSDKCKLNNKGQFTEDSNEDYVSAPHALDVMNFRKVIGLFLVTKEVESRYQRISDSSRSHTYTLRNDFNNLPFVFDKALTTIYSNFKLQFGPDIFYDNLDARYTCFDGKNNKGPNCIVAAGEDVKVNLTFKFDQCNNEEGKEYELEMVILKPIGFNNRIFINITKFCNLKLNCADL